MDLLKKVSKERGNIYNLNIGLNDIIYLAFYFMINCLNVLNIVYPTCAFLIGSFGLMAGSGYISSR